MAIIRKVFFAAAVLLFLLSACQGRGVSTPMKSDKPRDPSPLVNETDLEALVGGEQDFTFDFFQEIKSEQGNLFFSPYSITAALGMTYAGARGDTEVQMAQSLHYILPQSSLHPAFNKLGLELDSRARSEGVPDDKTFRLHVANALWGQNGFPFLPSYLDLLGENYGAGMHLLDFEQDPDGSRKIINQWVSQETEKRIENIIPPGVIDTLTRLVLSNAIYFKADWANEFDKEATSEGIFHLSDGSQVTVPMMNQHQQYNYVQGEGLQMLELPYAGHQLSMLLLLPEADKFTQVQDSLSAAAVNRLISNLMPEDVALQLPKFKYENSLSLKETLIKMGMTDAFDVQRADFSGMDGERTLYISAVLHKAFVAVDEAGTEAAAASVVIMTLRSMPIGSPLEFWVDRPFFFLIRDNPTGAILFLGRVLNPK